MQCPLWLCFLAIGSLVVVAAAADQQTPGLENGQPDVCSSAASDGGAGAECLESEAKWNWTAVKMRSNSSSKTMLQTVLKNGTAETDGRQQPSLSSHWTLGSDKVVLSAPAAAAAAAAGRDEELATQEQLRGNETSERDLLQTLAAKVLAMSAPFDASRSPQASVRCKAHVRRYLAALGDFEMWAIGMYDAAAKLPSGLLSGNINHLGNFDQCLQVNSADDQFASSGAGQSRPDPDPIRGKYCLAYMQPIVPASHQPRLKRLHGLIQSHGAFRSDFDDPGHRVPRVSMINWALCVPESCSAAAVEAALHETIAEFTEGTGIQMRARVEHRMCQAADIDKPYDRNTRWAVYFFVAIIVWTALSTVLDYHVARPNPYLVAFSLRRNVRSLFSLQRSPTDIPAIHGIRFVNAFMLVVSHKSMALFFDPYVNRTQMSESLGQPWTVIGRAAAIYTDVFLMFSGLLTAYSIFGRLQRGQPARLRQEYIGRLMRLVPTFGALILFCTYVLPNLGSGPQWNLVVGHHADICKQHWWKNMLFIHNYFGFENMCLTHTHHLGIDTELFAVAPLLILAIWRWPRAGVALVAALAAASTGGRYYVSVAYQLSNYVYFGATIKRLFRTADFMYAIPFYRATIYLLGILLGYVMRTHKDYRLSDTQLKVGWTVSSLLFAGVFLGPAPMGSIHYRYNAHHAAIYAALGPMAWCGLFAWIVFTTHLGYNSRLGAAMSWRGFLITTRLSYAIYLTQFPVFFFNVGRRRFAGHFEFLGHTLNVHEYFFIVLASVVLTLLFETPFQNIKKCLFEAPRPTGSAGAARAEVAKAAPQVAEEVPKVAEVAEVSCAAVGREKSA